MTVIAWDGQMLAADRMADTASTMTAVRKIFRVRDGLAGVSGDLSIGMEMLAWYEGGAVPSEYPISNRSLSEGSALTVVRLDHGVPRCFVYESSPFPFRVEDPFFARGSGAPEALVAMACGKTAAEAVLLAQQFNSTCGLGVDEMALEG